MSQAPNNRGTEAHYKQQQQQQQMVGAQGVVAPHWITQAGLPVAGDVYQQGGLPADAGSTAAEAPANTVKMSKVIAVEIKGTMGAFASMGPQRASWRPNESKLASIFASDNGMAGSLSGSATTSATAGGGAGGGGVLTEDLGSAIASLRNATITKATVLQSFNTFPVPLGVNISCLPTNEVCETGDRYTFTTIPNTSVNVPTKLYEAGECQTQAAEWRRNFARFTASNLETQDVLRVPNSPYVFVHESHPAINLLRMNRHLTGVDIDAMPKMDGQWFKITEPLMQSSCDTIREKVLANMATQDLTSLQVQLQRIGGVDWNHVTQTDALMTFAPNPAWSKEEFNAHMEAHQRQFTDKPGIFMARIHLEYEIQKP